ncbi:MAG: tryptophan 2,3-dioxygenase, partial [Bacteroidetes bacterium]|nr:tryptophan 2,3-dioxygenase [Bacteroidota bacterium]
ARYYIGGSDNQEAVEATGGSDWTKYMLPKYQKRVFFPEVWSDQELADWGKNV